MSHQLRSGEKSLKAFGLEMKEHPSCIGTRGYQKYHGYPSISKAKRFGQQKSYRCWVRALRVYATHPTRREDPLVHRCCSGSISSQILRATWRHQCCPKSSIESSFLAQTKTGNIRSRWNVRQVLKFKTPKTRKQQQCVLHLV